MTLQTNCIPGHTDLYTSLHTIKLPYQNTTLLRLSRLLWSRYDKMDMKLCLNIRDTSLIILAEICNFYGSRQIN